MLHGSLILTFVVAVYDMLLAFTHDAMSSGMVIPIVAFATFDVLLILGVGRVARDVLNALNVLVLACRAGEAIVPRG